MPKIIVVHMYKLHLSQNDLKCCEEANGQQLTVYCTLKPPMSQQCKHTVTSYLEVNGWLLIVVIKDT